MPEETLRLPPAQRYRTLASAVTAFRTAVRDAKDPRSRETVLARVVRCQEAEARLFATLDQCEGLEPGGASQTPALEAPA